MKKAMQISIGGIHFHIDEDAYNLLKEYTDSLRKFFSKEGDASNEIIDDIERRMAELLSSRISETKQVVSFDDVKEAINTLGKIEDFEFEKVVDAEPAEAEENTGPNRKAYRRLYRDAENSLLGGVCSGIAAYLNIEVWVIRLIFIIMLFINVIIPPFISLFGFGVLLYIILWIVVPKARTTAQKLQMRGEPVTAENIKRSVNDEYQKVKTSVTKVGSSDGFKKGISIIEEFFRTIGNVVLVFLKVIVYLIGIAFLITGILLLAGLGTFTFTRHQWLHRFDWPQVYLPDLSNIFGDPSSLTIVVVCIIILLAIPIISLIVWGIKLLTNVRGSNRVLQASALTIWVIALIVLIAMVFTESNAFAFQASSSDNEIIKPKKSSILYLAVENGQDVMEGVTVYSIFDYDIYYDKNREKILGKPTFRITESDNSSIELIINKSIRNINMKDADDRLREVEYSWVQKDSVIVFDNYFRMDEENKWRFAEVDIILKVPEKQKIQLLKSMERILQNYWITDSLLSWETYNKTLVMTNSGIKMANY